MNCLICNSVTQKLEHKEITYYICDKCKFIFKSPNIYPNFQIQKKRYDLHNNSEDDINYQIYFSKFLYFILPVIGRNIKKALDFGCGKTSLLAKLLNEVDIKCDYYDPIYHPNNLSIDKKYDLIVSTEVFEHLHNPKEIFASLVEKIKIGGYLAIQTSFYPKDIEKFKKWYYHQDHTHIVFFTPHTFKILGDMYGCEIVNDNNINMIVMKRII